MAASMLLRAVQLTMRIVASLTGICTAIAMLTNIYGSLYNQP